MTWEQRWMRRIVKGFVWTAALYLFAYLMEVDVTWRVVALVIICGIIDSVLDGWLPIDADATVSKKSA